MLETYDTHDMYGSMQDVGLGAVLSVQAGTYDHNDNPKTAFAPGEQIYFRANGEPNAGVLVGWTKDGVRQQDLSWDGVSTDSMGLARWRATAGPSGIGVGVFVYTIVIPVMGATLDPTATLRFTVGAVTSLPPVLPVNPTTPECSSTEQWDALLGRCVRKPTARPVPVLPPIDILDPKPDLYHTQTPVPPPPDACTPFGLVMATDGSGRCVVPRTTTERYGDTPEDIAQKAIAKARAEREAAAAASALAAAVAAQESAAVIADLRARLAAKENAVRATGGTVGAGSDSGGGGLDLPPWLDGELFGLPKLLVIGAGVLLVFMFKK